MIKVLKKKFAQQKRLLNKNLDFLLKRYNTDIKSIAESTKIPIATLFRMKKENYNPTLSSLEPLADFFRISLHDLIYEELGSEEYANKMKLGKIKYIPVFNMNTLKMWPSNSEPKLHIGIIDNLDEKAFGILIDSDLMLPIFYKNTIAIVDPSLEPKDSDYVLCTLEENSSPVLRQVFIDANNHFFKPINPIYGDMVHVKNFTIIGVVAKSIENYR